MRMKTFHIAASALLVATSVGVYLYITQRRGRKKWVPAGQISGITIYPLKSGPGIQLQRALCTEVGLVYGSLRDRQFVVYSGSRFITSAFNINMTKLRIKYNAESDLLLLTADGMVEISVSLDLSHFADNAVGNVCWYSGKTVYYLDCGDTLADWFTRLLGEKCRLGCYHPKLESREINAEETLRIAPERHPGSTVLYNSSEPYLICTQVSLDDLNSRLQEPVEFEAFRPNLTVETNGCVVPYGEDEWREISLGSDVVLYNEASCVRCTRINVDNNNKCMRQSKDPMKTLLRYRRGQLKKDKFRTIFGVVGPAIRTGWVSVGDPVTVVYGKEA